EKTRHRGRLHNVLVGVLLGGGAILTALTLAGFLGRAWWRLDLTAHFRLQYLLCLWAVAVGLAALRRLRLAGLALLVSLINLVLVAPLYLDGPGDAPSQGPSDGRTRLRAVSLNVSRSNEDHEAVRGLVRREDPDFLLLLEFTERWLDDLSDLTSAYPHVIGRPRAGHFGIALFSKHPFESWDVEHIGDEKLPSIVARVDLGDRELTLIGTHPRPPTNPDGARARNAHLAAIADRLQALEPPILLLGDLNVTPFSPWFRRFLDESGLRDSSLGHGYQATWPTYAPAFLIPIDHCLYSAGIRIADRRIGPAIGSDHLPLIVDFDVDSR
ncbi:MAG: endonuclease/exonuclease/phosphatase family protein, partial [Planctomycetota bacterium]